MLRIIFVCIGLIGYIKSIKAQEKQLPLRPNFIIVFVDDMGYGDLSCYGHPTIHTPNLDRMAFEGQKWTNFYVGASVCTPSRAALMTGRLPVRSGLASGEARVLFPNSINGMPASEITLAEQLKEAGYATGMVGKWHLGHKTEFLPTNHGFDSYYGIPYSNDMDMIKGLGPDVGYWDLWTERYEEVKSSFFNLPLLRDTLVVERPVDQTTLTSRYTKEAIAFVKQNKGKPFFLYLAHNLPHVPLFTSDDFKGSSKRGLYGDVVEEIDHGMGQLLEVLKEEGLDESTIVVFTSDNGPWLPTEISGGTAGMLRDGKGTTWEGGMRVPAIFWGPGIIHPKMVMDMGTTMDLFPTFTALAGHSIPEDRVMDGVDLSPVLLKGEAGDREVVWYYRGRTLFAARVGAYKAHFITQSAYQGDNQRVVHETPLLYNIEEDPGERFDISGKFPEVVQQIMEWREGHQASMVMGPDLLKDRVWADK